MTSRACYKTKGAQPEPNLGTKKAGSAVLINIDKTNQKMTVFLGEVEKYDWPVSTGKAGYSTPSGRRVPRCPTPNSPPRTIQISKHAPMKPAMR